MGVVMAEARDVDRAIEGDRLRAQAIAVSLLLSEAGIGAMPIPEGVKALTEQRDEARAFGEDTAAKYNALLDSVRTVTCAFCGDPFPRGTPRHGDGALAEHIKTCPAHPMREVEAERDGLLAYLHATTDEDGTHHRDWVADCQFLERERDAVRKVLVWPDGARPGGPDAEPVNVEARLVVEAWQAALAVERRMREEAEEYSSSLLAANGRDMKERNEALLAVERALAVEREVRDSYGVVARQMEQKLAEIADTLAAERKAHEREKRERERNWTERNEARAELAAERLVVIETIARKEAALREGIMSDVPIRDAENMTERPCCELCGDPMPAGEEMFKYHGYSGPCPAPPKPPADRLDPRDDEIAVLRQQLAEARELAEKMEAEVATWRRVLDEQHVANWTNLDAMTLDPETAIRTLLERALDMDRDTLRAALAAKDAEIERLNALDVLRCAEIQRLHAAAAKSLEDWSSFRKQLAKADHERDEAVALLRKCQTAIEFLLDQQAMPDEEAPRALLADLKAFLARRDAGC